MLQYDLGIGMLQDNSNRRSWMEFLQEPSTNCCQRFSVDVSFLVAAFLADRLGLGYTICFRLFQECGMSPLHLRREECFVGILLAQIKGGK